MGVILLKQKEFLISNNIDALFMNETLLVKTEGLPDT